LFEGEKEKESVSDAKSIMNSAMITRILKIDKKTKRKMMMKENSMHACISS
jgi:hypothetical protein